MIHEAHTVLDLYASRVAELHAEADRHRLASGLRRPGRAGRWRGRLRHAFGRAQPGGRGRSGSGTPVLR
jgi:hypothetical protein